jgi:hypothetical protein
MLIQKGGRRYLAEKRFESSRIENIEVDVRIV